MLAELLKMKFSIAVSGSHGKTTTTSMVATLLAHGGLDPTMVIGGKLASIGSNARLGDGEVIVAEADESDGSFLKLSPCLAVITNIDREHLDYYRDLEEIKEAFLQFANIVPFYGSTILCLDDPHVREILPRIKRTVITYGLSPEADYRAEEISFSGSSTRFSLCHRDVLLGSVKLNVPGLFNVYNALAAVAVAREMDLAFPVIREGLQRFTGVQRRLEVRGEAKAITVVDDYGHHPTEIRATLAAARQVWPGRIIVVFQPHRYTRTQALFEEFLTAFGDADCLIVTDIYAASEEPIPGVTAAALCEAIRRAGHPDALHFSELRRDCGPSGEDRAAVGRHPDPGGRERLEGGRGVSEADRGGESGWAGMRPGTEELRKRMAGKILFDEPAERHTSIGVGGRIDALCFPGERRGTRAGGRLSPGAADPLSSRRQLDQSDRPRRGLPGRPHLAGGPARPEPRATAADGGVRLEAEAGLPALRAGEPRRCARRSTGMEFCAGIPGSVGGAVRMNAGAYGGEIKDICIRSRLLDPTEGIRTVPRAELHFSYRNLDLPAETIIIGAAFRLRRGNGERSPGGSAKSSR